MAHSDGLTGDEKQWLASPLGSAIQCATRQHLSDLAFHERYSESIANDVSINCGSQMSMADRGRLPATDCPPQVSSEYITSETVLASGKNPSGSLNFSVRVVYLHPDVDGVSGANRQDRYGVSASQTRVYWSKGVACKSEAFGLGSALDEEEEV